MKTIASNSKLNRSAESKSPGSQRFYLKIDPVLSAITVISFAIRHYKLEHPRGVVFDELHYLKFITLYAKRIFFFDPQPPFGKQLFALVANITGFEGDLSYTQIGEPYKENLPIITLRLLPCICGSLLAPLVYLLCLELNFRQIPAALVSALTIVENSLITQSKFILLDPIAILLSTLSLYSYLKFHKHDSLRWLIFSSVCSALAFSTKYSGLYSYAVLISLVIRYWWQQLDHLDVRSVVKKLILYSACVIILPIAIYLGIYATHLAWLTRAGPHDSLMTSAFQASLENGLASITRGQPLEIVHGSQITLRHTHGRSCWLHSHEHLYPIKYSDGRGSSHQQQVTCYSFKDVNNWWIVKRPTIEELVVTEPHDRIRDGDLIQLVHGLTGRNLNSHDVASAISPYSQEVSCYVDHNISMPEQDVWQVRLLNPYDTEGFWHTINSRIQLIHLNSSLALRFSGRQLPDWGFHQHEIVADKELKDEDTIWNVEEHRYTKTDDQKERERQLGQAEFVPTEATSLTFKDKFLELHYKLFTYQQDAIKDHVYACESPLDWIFMSKGTAYWINNSLTDNAQIFLIGNTGNSLIGITCMILYALFGLFYIVRRQRHIYGDITELSWEKYQTTFIVIIGSYLANLLPYFLYESPLFLQHYLQALVFKIMAVGALVDHLYDIDKLRKFIPESLILVFFMSSFNVFFKLVPLTYGLSLSRDEVEALKWKDTWQLITI